MIMFEIIGALKYDCFNKNNINDIIEKLDKENVSKGNLKNETYLDDYSFLQLSSSYNSNTQSAPTFFWNNSKDKVIAFTGKIYNKKKLCESFFSQHGNGEISDAQIVLQGMEQYGDDFLKKIDGKFSFVIYDIVNKEFILGRDRLGNIPLYYYKSESDFLFSTSLKKLLSLSVVPLEIDREALSQFLQLTYIPAPKSIIKNISKVLPATIIRIDCKGNLKSEKYWSISANKDILSSADYSVCKKKLRSTLIESVEQRIENENSVGAFLSGGFDSTIVVGIMAMLQKNTINTFTVGFNDKKFDERSYVNAVVEKNKTNHRELVLDVDNVFNEIDEILANMDEPYADSSLIATYSISKIANKYVSTVLTGDGGDEIFAGYNKYLISYYSELYNKIPGFFRNKIIKPFINNLPADSRLRRKAGKVINVSERDIFEQRKQLMCLGFKEKELKHLMKDGFVDSMAFANDYYNELTDVDEQMKAQYLDLKVVLEGDMLPKAYKAGVMSGVDSRAPMLGNSVVELAYQMPSEFKINRFQRKIILKETFSDLIPKELYSAPKHGFSVPISSWIEKNIKDKLYKYASREFLEKQGLFNADYILEIIDEHMKHISDRYSELWAFYVFQDWYVKVFGLNI